VLLTSEEPAVRQFLNGSRIGPIGMSEEKDQAQLALERAHAAAGHHDGSTEDVRGVVPQLQPTPGLPERAGARRRRDRVMQNLRTLPPAAQQSIVDSLTPLEQHHYGIRPRLTVPARGTGTLPTQHQGQLPTDQVARLPQRGRLGGDQRLGEPGPGGK